jgi:hypothetical protein
MTEQLHPMVPHPMVPPNILLNNWESDWFAERESIDALLTQAYQAGADAELEACCEWLVAGQWFNPVSESFKEFRAARRPKQPSLKEQALQALEALKQRTTDPNIVEPLRYALEALPDD